MKRAWLGPGVAVILLSGCGGQSAGALAQPSPTPVVDYGPPPAGVPLLYVHDPAQASWLIGFDWSGKPRGTVKPPVDLDPSTGLSPAPDGSAFQLGGGAKGGSGIFLDRLGQPMANADVAANTVGGTWADDNRHQCLVTLDQRTFVWGLSTVLPGEAPRAVAVIARDAGIGQTGIGVVACSVRQNLAVLARTTIWWPTELWVVRLSDGKFLAHHEYEGTALVTVVANVDGTYVAESSANAQGLNPKGAARTTIRRVADWTVVATLDPSFQVLDFTSDGSLVLATTQLDSGQAPSHLAIIDWRSGRVVWRYVGPESLYRSTVEPDESGFALALRAPTRYEPAHCGAAPYGMCHEVSDPLNDILIVHGDGTTTAITGRYNPLW